MIARALAAVVVLLAPAAAAAQRVTVTPDTVRLEHDAAPVVRAQDAPGDAQAVRWITTLGVVRAGVLDLSGRRAPGFAIVAGQVDGDGGWRAAAVVTLIGRGELPTVTSPGAQVTVEIDGKSFGPARADARGRAVVPVEVSPRVKTATVIAVDARGRSSSRQVALPAADHPRGLVIAPAALARGERGTVTIFAIGAGGVWRDAGAAAPELDLPTGLEADGAIVAVGPGRWDQPVRARADLAATRGVTVGARVDGAPAVPAGLALTAPATTAPARFRPDALVDVTLRGGGVSAFGDLASGAVAIDAGLTLWTPGIELAATLGLARLVGSGGEVVQDGLDRFEIDQTLIVGGARAMWHLGPRVRAEVSASVGWIIASGVRRHNNKPENDKALEQSVVVVVAGGAAGVRLGPGLVLLDVRFGAAGYEKQIANASPLGLWLSAGYRLGF